MLISVIAIFYNSEPWCRRCIDSILKQKDVNLELIAIDDASPSDNTLQILRSYAQFDSRIRVFHHEKNKGISEARNTGLENVRGDVFYLTDGDDWLTDEYSLKKLESHWSDGMDWLGGSYEFVDDNGKQQRCVRFPDIVCKSKEEIIKNFSSFDFVYTHNRLVNSKFKDIKFRKRIHEDRFWNVDAFSRLNHIGCCSEITYTYYSRVGSFSGGSIFKKQFSEDGLQLLTLMTEYGGEWASAAKSLAITILKSCYCSDSTKDFRNKIRTGLYEQKILPYEGSLAGYPRFTQMVYLFVNAGVPDCMIRVFVKCYLFYLFKIRKTTF